MMMKLFISLIKTNQDRPITTVITKKLVTSVLQSKNLLENVKQVSNYTNLYHYPIIGKI